MFDDYNFKRIDKRIRIKFVQEKEETMFPWELAKFMNGLNTVYYKYEILNSICSAINNGIKAENIFIFDKSLPLNKSYSNLNILNINEGAVKSLYYIGLPIPLIPERENYSLNLIFHLFKRINSTLKLNKCRPMFTEILKNSIQLLNSESIEVAEKYIIDSAAKVLKRRKVEVSVLSRVVDSYQNKKAVTYANIEYILSEKFVFNEEPLVKPKNKKYYRFYNTFFDLFEKITRPLVIAKLDNGQYRVLARSLVNKTDKKTEGLELKEIRRNSPLAGIFEGGSAIYRTIKEEGRARELHKMEIEKIELEKTLLLEKIEGEKLENLKKKIDIMKSLQDIANESDITAINKINNDYLAAKLNIAYGRIDTKRNSLLSGQGLKLSDNDTQIIDIKL